MRRSTLAFSCAVAAALLGAACTTDQSTTPTTADPVPAVTSATVATSTPGEIPATTVAGATVAPPTGELTAGAGPSVAVKGGELPEAVASAYTDAGGELATSAEFDARFDTFGLPRIVGDGVRLVEATIDAKLLSSGWVRTDELQWLFMDTGELGSLLDQVAAAAGVTSWPMSEQQQIDNGANCVTRAYDNAAGVTWRVQGCDFPRFPGMLSLGVGRDGTFATAPGLLDPTVDQVATATGGTLTGVAVIFSKPTMSSNVTLTVRAVVATSAGQTDTVERVTGGPLAGWTQIPGDAEVMLVDPGGVRRWSIAGGYATLVLDGRVAS